MIVRKILALRGPNVWGRVPVLEVWVEFASEYEAAEANAPAVQERLVAAVEPALKAAKGPCESLLVVLREERDPAEILALVLRASGVGRHRGPVSPHSHRGRSAHGEGRCPVPGRGGRPRLPRRGAVPSRPARGPRDADHFGSRPPARAGQGRRFWPNTAPVVAAAQARGIPVRRLNSESLIQLGHAPSSGGSKRP